MGCPPAVAIHTDGHVAGTSFYMTEGCLSLLLDDNFLRLQRIKVRPIRASRGFKTLLPQGITKKLPKSYRNPRRLDLGSLCCPSSSPAGSDLHDFRLLGRKLVIDGFDITVGHLLHFVFPKLLVVF